MKSLDVVLAVIIRCDHRFWTVQSLANILGLSTSVIHGALKRLETARLLERHSNGMWDINPKGLEEVLLYVVPYIFPIQARARTRGVVTGGAAFNRIHDAFDRTAALVWPHPEGDAQGQQVQPLHHALPAAVLTQALHRRAYHVLALADLQRLGQARERAMAKAFIKDLVNQVGVPHGSE